MSSGSPGKGGTVGRHCCHQRRLRFGGHLVATGPAKRSFPQWCLSRLAGQHPGAPVPRRLGRGVPDRPLGWSCRVVLPNGRCVAGESDRSITADIAMLDLHACSSRLPQMRFGEEACMATRVCASARNFQLCTGASWRVAAPQTSILGGRRHPSQKVEFCFCFETAVLCLPP